MRTIQFAILLMSFLDLFLTYNYISAFHKKFPKLDQFSLEANPLLRKAMRKFGLGKGIIIGGIGILVFLSLLVFLVFDDNLLFYFSGCFTMMLIYHWANCMQLAQMKIKRRNNHGK